MSKKKLKKITIKIGTRVLTDNNNRIDREVIDSITSQISDLMDRGIEVILVSSGAIGAGLGLLAIKKKNRSLSELQAAASIGQNHLMDIYNEFFSKRGYITGQILLTQDDFNVRKRFLNIRYTINTLLKFKAIPVINENDSVSTNEIKCGDNDRLSALVADVSNSDMLFILTDVEGLYDASGERVKHVDAVTATVKSFCRGKGCDESTGGMITKLEAVKNAASSGIRSVIARGKTPGIILDIVNGRDVGTRFDVKANSLNARKRWIAFSVKPKGVIIIDEGAEKALVSNNRSLLPGGIRSIDGKFSEGDLVEIVAGKKVIARGLTNYSSDEIVKIKGKRSDRIEKELGYKDYDEVVHRDNLVIIDNE